MAVTARFLVDTSASARLGHPAVRERLVPLIAAGLVGTCGALDLEALWSARSPQEHATVRADRRAAYERLPTVDEDWGRAVEVQSVLAERGSLRAVGLADLVVCAVAERERVTVLHYDADHDTVAGVTGQRVEWVVPRGSVP